MTPPDRSPLQKNRRIIRRNTQQQNQISIMLCSVTPCGSCIVIFHTALPVYPRRSSGLLPPKTSKTTPSHPDGHPSSTRVFEMSLPTSGGIARRPSGSLRVVPPLDDRPPSKGAPFSPHQLCQKRHDAVIFSSLIGNEPQRPGRFRYSIVCI